MRTWKRLSESGRRWQRSAEKADSWTPRCCGLALLLALLVPIAARSQTKSVASAYFVDRLTNQGTSNDQVISAYTRPDTGLTWKPLEEVPITVFGQNLLKAYRIEFEDKFGSMQSSQIRRGAYAKLIWHF
jgi:hypothetical protein